MKSCAFLPRPSARRELPFAAQDRSAIALEFRVCCEFPSTNLLDCRAAPPAPRPAGSSGGRRLERNARKSGSLFKDRALRRGVALGPRPIVFEGVASGATGLNNREMPPSSQHRQLRFMEIRLQKPDLSMRQNPAQGALKATKEAAGARAMAETPRPRGAKSHKRGRGRHAQGRNAQIGATTTPEAAL